MSKGRFNPSPALPLPSVQTSFRFVALVVSMVVVIALTLLPTTRSLAAASTAPSNLNAVAVSVAEVDLTWDAPSPTGTVTYRIQRNGQVLATIGGTDLSYVDTTVRPSSTYAYMIQAVDAAGMASPPSRAAVVKTPALPETSDTLPPSPPEELVAVAGDGFISLYWDGGNDDTDVTAYRIMRNGNVLATVNSGMSTYKDQSVEVGVSYTYTVESLDVVGHRSRPSEAGTATPRRRGSAPAMGVLATGTQTSANTLATAAATYSSSLTRYPYLTDVVNDPTDASKGYATVNWATDRSATSGAIKWGQLDSSGSCNLVGSSSYSGTNTNWARTGITVNSVAEYQWKAQLTLSPGTQYCYRVFLGNADLLGTDPSPRFWTQVPNGATQPFSFAVFGDWGAVDSAGNNPDQANVMQQIAASGARFAVTVGDNGYPSGSQNNYGDLQQAGTNLSGIFGPSFWKGPGASIPLFPAIGNHGFTRSDVNHPHLLNWPQDRAVSTSGGRYQKDCCIGTTSYASAWYAFDAGNTRFYILHATWYDLCTPSDYECDYNEHWQSTSSEYQWLENDLKTHPSALKFAVLHYPLYSDQLAEASDPFLQGASSLEGLLNKYGVALTFTGHAHIYQRNLSASTTGIMNYLSGGGGGDIQSIAEAGCNPLDAYGIGWSDSKARGNACGSAPVPTAKEQVYHFLKVSVNGTTVKVEPTSSLGQTFDVQTYDFSSAPTAGTLSGKLTDANSGAALSGATVSYSGGSTTTNGSGAYTLINVTPGSYTLSANTTGYNSQSATVTVTAGTTTTQDFALTASTGTLSGKVNDTSSGAALSGATVSYSGGSTTTDATGTYRLTNVTPGSYTLSANAVGYTSQSATVTVTAGTTTTQNFALASAVSMRVFQDGFEAGNLSAWTTNAGLIVQNQQVHAGTYAAQGNTTNGNTYAKKTLPSSYNDGFARIYFNVVSSSSQVNLLRFRAADDSSLGYVFVSSTGSLGLRNDVAGTTTTSTTSVGSGWHALELHMLINGSASTAEVWLDGAKVTALSMTTNLGTAAVGRLQIGDVQTGRTYNVLFDDVVFDIQRIGP